MQLVEGMEIPGDGYLIEASDVSCDESAMTGETDPIKKNTLRQCMVKRDDMIREGLDKEAKHHDVPTPIILSGTKVRK